MAKLTVNAAITERPENGDQDDYQLEQALQFDPQH